MRLLRPLIAAGAVALALRCTPEAAAPPVTLQSGLVLQELRIGAGEEATDGCYLALHYDARIAAAGVVERSDPPYDSTRSGDPFFAKLGKTPLLPGFADGIRGMKEGGRRRLTIPPALGYAATGKGRVPPDATLEYEVELVAVFERRPSGLQYWVAKEGRGEPARPGTRVVLDFKAWLLESGREVASSRMLGRALEFPVGEGRALPGLEEALALMKPGSRFILALPPELGWGPLGRIPLLLPGQEVLFDVELAGTRPR
jgi:FKBP-type peptidyl-prolyl cis-trans isomerase